MVTISLPDGAKRELPDGANGTLVAEAISKSLAKRAVAMKVDGVLSDLSDRVPDGARVEIVTRDDPAALELIRHDCAHVLAEAVQELFPGTQVTIGPVIENGFYYDFFRNEPFSTDDFAAIEAKMREIVAARRALHQGGVGARPRARRSSRRRARCSRSSWSTPFPQTRTLKIYCQGDWFDLCRGPHMPSTGQLGDAFKLTKLAGAYWRGDSSRQQLQRIYGTAWRNQEELDAYLQHDRGGGEARPPPHRPRDGPVPSAGGGARHGVLAPEGLGDLARAGSLPAPAPRRGRLPAR